MTRMPSKLKTAIAFVKNIRTTGAISQTSKRTEEEITRHINMETRVVVEFGMGHGNITEKILSKLPQHAKLYAFEVNSDFCEVVQDKIKDDRLIIVNDSAENIRNYVKGPINNLISSMPLTMFSEVMTEAIFTRSFDLLAIDGCFSQILYNKQSSSKFDQYFHQIDMKGVGIVIPPQFVYHCTNLVNLG